MMKQTTKQFLLLTIMLLSTLPLKAETTAEEWVYSVRPGDTIWSICTRYIQEPECWRKVGPYNGIDLPRRLPPGSVLRIPVTWLKTPPAPVMVKELSGQVFVQRMGSAERVDLALGDQLNKGDKVITEQGQLLLEFADGAKMQLERHTEVVFDRLRYVRGDKSLVDTYLRLNQGAANTDISPDRHKYKFQIETPAGIAGVRGTKFRTRLGEQKAAQKESSSLMTEVLSGLVAVSQNKQEVEVKKGFGLVSVKGQALSRPEKLLPKVILTSPDRQAAPLKIQWQPLKAAKAYRVVLKKQDKTIALINRKVLQDNLILPDLADGQYQLFVSAIAASGLQGELSKAALTVNTPLTPVVINKASLSKALTLNIRWKKVENAQTYQLMYATSNEFKQSKIITIDAAKAYKHQFSAADLKQGKTLWVRMRALSSNGNYGEWSEAMLVEVRKGINWLGYIHAAMAVAIFIL